MNCSKCGSNQVNTQIVSKVKLKKKHHSIFYWVLIGWWWKLLLWIILTLPMLVIKIFRPKKYKLKTKETKVAVCQNCGHSWRI